MYPGNKKNPRGKVSIEKENFQFGSLPLCLLVCLFLRTEIQTIECKILMISVIVIVGIVIIMFVIIVIISQYHCIILG